MTLKGSRHAAEQITLLQIARLAVCLGFLVGFLEAGLIHLRRLFPGQVVLFGADLVWMAPLAEALVLVVFSLPLYGGIRLVESLRGRLPAPVRRWLRPATAPAMAVFGIVMVASMALAVLWSGLAFWGALVLSAGIAVQIASYAGRRWLAIDGLLRRGLPLLLGLELLAVITVFAGAYALETLAISRLPPARSSAPNVIFITLDTVRTEDMSLYGYDRPTTPWLEQFAAGGVVYERAYATAPWTLPSHASLMTGCWPKELAASWMTPLQTAVPTLAERLQAAGYRTAGFIANINYVSAPRGLGRGFEHYEDFPVNLGQFILSSSLLRKIDSSDRIRNLLHNHELLGRKTAADINRSFLGWLDGQAPGGRPFFAFLNYYDAHEPYLPPEPFWTSFGPMPPPNDQFVHNLYEAEREMRWMMTSAQAMRYRNAYDGAIAYMDAQLKDLFSTLKRRGWLENTLVIITSDHGEQFGEHGGLFGHVNSLYIQTLHVPLVVVYPGRVTEGVRVAQPVSLRNVAATILELAGLPASLPGASLVPASAGAAQPQGLIYSQIESGGFAWAEFYPIVKGDIHSLIAGDYHYIRGGDGSEGLYNLRLDPAEEKNLAADPAEAARLAELGAALDETLTAAPECEPGS